MTQENPNANPSGGGTEPEIVTVPRAELDQLKAGAARDAKFVQEANSLGFTDPDEYMMFLQENKLKELSGAEPAKPAGAVTPDPAKPPVIDDKVSARIDQANNLAMQGALGVQFFEYKEQIREADPQAKPPFSRQELDAVIRTRSASVGEIAKEAQHGGNFYSAAAFLLSLPQVQAKAAANGAAAAAALNSAANSANLSSAGGSPPKPSGGAEDTATKLRSIIAPKAGVYEG